MTQFTSSVAISVPTIADYDLASLSQAAEIYEWDAGDDPDLGSSALLDTLEAPSPPLHLILGQAGLDVVALYEARRAAERDSGGP